MPWSLDYPEATVTKEIHGILKWPELHPRTFKLVAFLQVLGRVEYRTIPLL